MAYAPNAPIDLVPTTGGTADLINNMFDGLNQSVHLVPAGLIAAYTIKLMPAVAGQTVRFWSAQQITVLTVTSNNSQSGFPTTVNAGVVLMPLNGSFSWSYSETQKTWLKGN